MYMINKIRPNAIPWGTIDVTGTVLGGIPFTTTALYFSHSLDAGDTLVCFQSLFTSSYPSDFFLKY